MGWDGMVRGAHPGPRFAGFFVVCGTVLCSVVVEEMCKDIIVA